MKKYSRSEFAGFARAKLLADFGTITAAADALECSCQYLRNFLSTGGRTQPPKELLEYLDAEKIKVCEIHFSVN